MTILIEAERLLAYKATGVSELTEWQKGWNDAIDTIVVENQAVYAEPTMWVMDKESHRCLTFPKEETSVRRGHWVRNDNGTYSCSECRSWIPDEQHYYARYCLFCGAKMDEVCDERT